MQLLKALFHADMQWLESLNSFYLSFRPRIVQFPLLLSLCGANLSLEKDFVFRLLALSLGLMQLLKGELVLQQGLLLAELSGTL